VPWIVPDMTSVRVEADRAVNVTSSLEIGGVARVPRTLGLPAASHGRRRVRCLRGSVSLDRWIALGTQGDLVWPPLPEGDWDVDVELDGGAVEKLRVTIDRNDGEGSEPRRR